MLEDGQCDIGAVNSSILSSSPLYADAGRLYVDFWQPAQCSGEVVRWEFCYISQMVRSGPGSRPNSDQNTITAVVLRRDTDAEPGSYRIINVYDINIDGAKGSSEGYLTVSDYIDSEDGVFMERGDLLGFVCDERFRIIFTSSSSNESQPGGAIRVFNISSTQQDTSGGNWASYLLNMNPIREDQFESLKLNDSVTPLLRAIMSKQN